MTNYILISVALIFILMDWRAIRKKKINFFMFYRSFALVIIAYFILADSSVWLKAGLIIYLTVITEYLAKQLGING